MSTPMFDVPEHLIIPVNEQGQGPVDEAEAHHWACWCGKESCVTYFMWPCDKRRAHGSHDDCPGVKTHPLCMIDKPTGRKGV